MVGSTSYVAVYLDALGSNDQVDVDDHERRVEDLSRIIRLEQTTCRFHRLPPDSTVLAFAARSLADRGAAHAATHGAGWRS